MILSIDKYAESIRTHLLIEKTNYIEVQFCYGIYTMQYGRSAITLLALANSVNALQNLHAKIIYGFTIKYFLTLQRILE